MSPPVSARADCRLCGSRDLSTVLSFGETPLANSYLSSADLGKPELFAPLVVNFCNACSLVQLRDVVDPAVLFSHYLYVSGTSPAFVAHFADYAATMIERFSLGAESLVVDIGSNDGSLLTQFKNRGTRILGLDPALNIASEATARGIPTIVGFFTREAAQVIAAGHGKARLITANNVFAHTDDVAEFIEAVKDLLAPDGVFVFEVQYLKDLIEKNLFDIIYHEHLCYYHVTPLVPFFERRGLQIVGVDRVPTHGGSIRVAVARQSGPHARAGLDEILAGEAALNDRRTYDAFAERIASNKARLLEMIAAIKTRNERIVGYGAPAKATTLGYAFGLDRSNLEYIVDDATLKQGLFMPGTHVPITLPETLYDNPPHYCLILAWNFADAIMKSHARFRDIGGRFIIPVPEPRTV